MLQHNNPNTIYKICKHPYYYIYNYYTLQNIPPFININLICNVYDTYYITNTELKYQLFIEQNHPILILTDTIEYYLDVRDALLLRLSQLRIIKKNKK